ncbi:MAG TPA: RhuM family protein, partial [Thermoanaerobaculia bacterium]|nr:RhuM family protein [Thermoanaerobaculia bacterium]
MAELFQTTKQNVSLHVRNLYEEGELTREGTVKESLTVRSEGGREVQRRIDLHNLDVIISVGYRVKSHRGTQVRIWATERLREYLVKGFALDDERLKEVLTLPGGRDADAVAAGEDERDDPPEGDGATHASGSGIERLGDLALVEVVDLPAGTVVSGTGGDASRERPPRRDVARGGRRPRTPHRGARRTRAT